MGLFKNSLPRYDGMLELHAERFSCDPNISDDELGIRISLACKIFEQKTGVPVRLLGRMGRHVCVEDSSINSKNYQYLRKTALTLLRDIVLSDGDE